MVKKQNSGNQPISAAFVRTNFTHEFGLKISPAQREYYRYTGVSAEIERHGVGTSRPELSWIRRSQQRREQDRSQGSSKMQGE
jgi:hypothetical protein